MGRGTEGADAVNVGGRRALVPGGRGRGGVVAPVAGASGGRHGLGRGKLGKGCHVPLWVGFHKMPGV